jgi:hypothetical protein
MAEEAREISYVPNLSAVPFHESKAQVKSLCGPVGSGKSSVACWEFFFLCMESKVPIRGCVIRETYRQLADSTKQTWMEWFGDVSEYIKSEEQVRLTIRCADGIIRTHTIDFRHARRTEEASNFMSTEYAFIWFEEPVPAFDVGAGVIGGGIPKGVFDIALTRQRQAGAHRIHLILTYNPPNKFHWCYDEFFRRTPAELEAMGYAHFRQPARENKAHLPHLYYERLAQRLSPEMARRFVEGEPVTMYPGVRVYPQVSEAIHFRDLVEPIPGLPLISCHDFGRTPAAVFFQHSPKGQIRVLKELQMWDASTRTFAKEMTRVLKDDLGGLKWGRGYGDPAGANPTETDDRTSFQILAAEGYPIAAGAMTVKARTDTVKDRCRHLCEDGEPGLIISRFGAPFLSEALLGGYRYPKSNDGQVGSAPMKNEFSHIANAFEYGMTGEFEAVTGESQHDLTPRMKEILPSYDPLGDSNRGRRGGWMTR